METNGIKDIEEIDYLCPVCAEDFDTLRQFEEHKSTDEHRMKWLNKVYSLSRLEYVRDKYGISIEVINESIAGIKGINHKPGDYTIEVAADECTVSFTLRVHNKGSEAYHLIGIDLLKTTILLETDSDITIKDTFSMTKRKKIIIFRSGSSYDVVCKIQPGNISRVLHIPLLFEFHTIKKEKVSTEIQEAVKNFYVGRTLEIKGKIYSVRDFGNFIPGVYPLSEFHSLNELKNDLPLEKYFIPPWFQTLAYNNKKVDIYKEMKISPHVTFQNYRQFFRTLLWLEELQHELDIQFHSKKEITFHFPRDDFRTGLKLVEFSDPSLLENRPCVMKRDKVFVCLSEEAKKTDKPQWYQGVVHQVKNKSVCLGFHQEKFVPKFDGKTKFNLEFTINRHNFRVCHRAVDLCTSKEACFQNILFPSKKKIAKNSKGKYKNMNGDAKPNNFPDITLLDENINYEQLQAIQQIVFGTQRSSPYVIFGPPGTGKTVTIVEAIKQIFYIVPESYVLACAPSNSAADVITERLLDHFTEQRVFRMYSESRTRALKNLPKSLLNASNYIEENKKVYFPSRENLMAKRIIVCTFITAAKIAAARFPEGHFTHVILDEAGHAMECEALIGVGGILAPKGKLILAGDPHQLGPMIRSMQAGSKGHIFKKTGLDISLLERIMNIPLYSNEDGYYNTKYVTKLVKNYRSHYTILKVPNEIFYKSELMAEGNDCLVNEYTNWEYLPRRGFPIIVHSVAGEDKTEAHSPSYHNPEEVREVIRYLHKLSDTNPEDIGIITPYRLQVEKLRKELERIGKEKVKVGSVEDFQGEERKVIIISTVRANKKHLAKDDLFKLGFFRNPKRFNVAVTRAQCLLILVCCSDVLLLDENNWKRLIDYAREKGGYVGEKYRIPKESIEEIIKRNRHLDIRPHVGDISKKQLVEVPSWKRHT